MASTTPRAGKQAAKAKSAGARPTGRKSAKGRPAGAVRRTPPRPKQSAPELTFGTLIAPDRSGGWAPMVMRAAGALAVVGAVALVVGQYTPYADLSGQTVTAPVSVLSVLAQLVLLTVVAGAGVLLAIGRAGRAAMSALLAFGATAVGSLMLAIFQTSSIPEHPTTDFYFGKGYETTSITGLTGHTLTVAGQGALVVALILCAICWPRIEDNDPVPLEGARVGVALASVGAGIIGLIAFYNPPVFPAVRVTKPDGITEVPVDVQVPAGPGGMLGLGRAGGITFMVTVLIVGVLIAFLLARTSVIGGLVGLSGFFAYEALLNFRDVIGNPDFVAGVRSYLLAAATVITAAGAVYATLTRRRRTGPLGAETDEI
ncbi:hypothetical protein CLV47_12215 [Antricoccus suffuscus]|uniref:Uncharacterized protein n=1 Tax=Antricoccus suffuscus TaxID=1629062 RepID=A0A2T0ZFR4_9ACTN|nr:hypothetical protein [Antricoccus suffuscus]PRZ35195.1 hypothetical protein CLV47_12215 [Antricoccus suffuscus]